MTHFLWLLAGQCSNDIKWGESAHVWVSGDGRDIGLTKPDALDQLFLPGCS